MVSQTLQAAKPILVSTLTWQEFKLIEPVLDRPGIRLSFLDGILEIWQMPGEKHETIKERMGTLLDLYFLKLGIDYTPTGSMTLESETTRVRREADKSYKLGADRLRPDLAIEVVIESGGIDKLEAYKRLNIAEVWFWQDDNLSLYGLRSNGNTVFYEELRQSELLPELNISLLVRCMNASNHTAAVREFRQAIQDS